MLKTLSRLMLVGLLSLLLTGGWVFPWPFVRVAPTIVPPRGGPPPTPVLPILRLEYAGSAVSGGQQSFSWATGSSGMWVSGSGPWPPHLRETLAVPAGASVDIVVGHSSPPAAIWVVELDSAGIPKASTALTPTSSTVSYTLSTSGSLVLQVMAQWTYQNYVVYLFSLEVGP